MKKTSKKPGTIGGITKTSSMFAQQQIYFDILKNKVQSTEKVMIAVSGGTDSILTASLVYNFFLKNKYNLQNLFFIHCNHNTRAGNSTDEQFIKKFFEGTQLIIVKRKSSKKANEAELRNRRYNEFKIQTKKYYINQLLFGHNLTDRIESTFLNLLRGANMNGFLAMQTQEEHHLIPGVKILRPILGLTKDEITNICKQNKISFITDPTNADTTTSLRNKLRNKVLPELYKLANKQTSTTNSFIESMKNIYDTLEKSHGEKILNSEFGTLNSIKKSPHRNAKFAYQRIIDPKSVTNEGVMQAMKTLDSSNNITTPLLKERTKFLQDNESGYKYFNKTYLFKSHGKIYFISGQKLFREKTIDTSQKITKLGNINREGQKYDIDKKEYLGAEIRFPKKGDTYKKKTRNEWCINQKIPIFQRNLIPIVVKKNQILKVFK
ncbi:MAG: tRNA lysidine(34) synthetase TilS [Candidatus Absconditabacterales bacterium]